jgi:hypothetical protein
MWKCDSESSDRSAVRGTHPLYSGILDPFVHEIENLLRELREQGILIPLGGLGDHHVTEGRKAYIIKWCVLTDVLIPFDQV